MYQECCRVVCRWICSTGSDRAREGESYRESKCVGFVKYLKGRNLSGWAPANNRVLTEFYEALASKNITMYDKFMRAYVGTLSKGKVHRVRGGALYERFETWCGNKQYVVSTNTMFGREGVGVCY